MCLLSIKMHWSISSSSLRIIIFFLVTLLLFLEAMGNFSIFHSNVCINWKILKLKREEIGLLTQDRILHFACSYKTITNETGSQVCLQLCGGTYGECILTEYSSGMEQDSYFSCSFSAISRFDITENFGECNTTCT